MICLIFRTMFWVSRYPTPYFCLTDSLESCPLSLNSLQWLSTLYNDVFDTWTPRFQDQRNQAMI